MISKYLLKISGICGIFLPIILFVILVYSLIVTPWFSWTENAISDLGRPVIGNVFFNYGIIIIGVFFLIFSFGLFYSLKGERVGPLVFALSSIYFIGVGFNPLPDPAHVDLSGLFFVAFPLGFLIMSLRLIIKDDVFLKKMGLFALLVVLISGFATIFLLFFNGIAIPEAMILFPGFIWCMIYGIYLTFDIKIEYFYRKV